MCARTAPVHAVCVILREDRDAITMLLGFHLKQKVCISTCIYCNTVASPTCDVLQDVAGMVLRYKPLRFSDAGEAVSWCGTHGNCAHPERDDTQAAKCHEAA